MDFKDLELQGQELDITESEGWVSKKIEEVIQHKKGCAFKSEWFVTSGKPVIKVSNFTNDSIDLSDCLFLNEVKAVDFKEYEMCTDDIIIATVGSWPNNPASIVGKVVKAPKKVGGYLLNQNAVILRSKNSKMVNQVFLFYRLRNKDFSEYVVSGAQGSANQASITLKSIFNFEFSLPPIREQEIIAQTLSNLDSKIELNHQMNKTLEAVGEAVFKRWFIDFEFPNQEGKPYKSLDGEMVTSELGEIPKDWVLKKLGDVLELAYGKPLKDSARCPGRVPVYGSNGQIGCHKEELVRGPGIVVGRKGNPGTIVWSNTDFFPIDTTFYVVLKNELKSFHYLFYVLKKQNLPALSADSAVPGLNRNIAYLNDVLVPPSEILIQFDKLVSGLRAKIHQNSDRNSC
jgi:type I restriction enzyme S subunit